MNPVNMQRNYRNTIWTNHALNRLQERRIPQGDAWAAWRRPDATRYAASRGGWVRGRTFGNRRIETVSKKNERGEWVILSVWTKQVPGRPRRHRSLLGNIFRFFLFGTWD